MTLVSGYKDFMYTVPLNIFMSHYMVNVTTPSNLLVIEHQPLHYL